MLNPLSTVIYKPCFHSLSTNTSHSFFHNDQNELLLISCSKKIVMWEFQLPSLLPLPVIYSAVATGSRHHGVWTDTEDIRSISVSDCLLSTQDIITISPFTASSPSEASMFSFLTVIKSQKKIMNLFTLLFHPNFSLLLYNTAWNFYFMLTIANFFPLFSAGSCLAKGFLGSTITITFVIVSFL